VTVATASCHHAPLLHPNGGRSRLLPALRADASRSPCTGKPKWFGFPRRHGLKSAYCPNRPRGGRGASPPPCGPRMRILQCRPQSRRSRGATLAIPYSGGSCSLNISTTKFADLSPYPLLMKWTCIEFERWGLLIPLASSSRIPFFFWGLRHITDGKRMALNGSAATSPPRTISFSICFSPTSPYGLHERFSAPNHRQHSFAAAKNSRDLENGWRGPTCFVISGLWHNGLLDRARKTSAVLQADSAQAPTIFPALDGTAKRGIRLAERAPGPTTDRSRSTRWPSSSQRAPPPALLKRANNQANAAFMSLRP